METKVKALDVLSELAYSFLLLIKLGCYLARELFKHEVYDLLLLIDIKAVNLSY